MIITIYIYDGRHENMTERNEIKIVKNIQPAPGFLNLTGIRDF
jgi:hypothetical protein